ncbi:hypothetical protein ABW19_dt0204019 [Dactylella cylindrospora]|nr:hypothetical protein ABW19_dt0204019 [Dactylella cylindrospora]
MPLLDPSEVAALGLSTKDIPAHKQLVEKSKRGDVANSRTADLSHSDTGSRNSASSSPSRVKKQRKATKNVSSRGIHAASPLNTTVSANAATAISGKSKRGDTMSLSPIGSMASSGFSGSVLTTPMSESGWSGWGREFEVRIEVPSRRKLEEVRRYQKYPDADAATVERNLGSGGIGGGGDAMGGAGLEITGTAGLFEDDIDVDAYMGLFMVPIEEAESHKEEEVELPAGEY